MMSGAALRRRMAWGRLTFALVALLLAAGSATPLAAPVFTAPRVPILDAPEAAVSSGAEPSILAARDGTLYVGDTSGLSRSVNGGASWQHVSIPFIDGLFTDGFALAEDDDGVLYVAVTNGQLISVGASADRGATWRVTDLVDASIVADRPWIAARGHGQIAILYYDSKTTREACLASNDGGVTFLTRYVGLVATPNAGNALFGPNGALYYSTSNVAYRWSTPCSGEPTRLLHGATSGASTFTQFAVDPSGNMFVAGPPSGNGAMTVYGKAATGGQWRAIKVSTNAERSNTYATISAIDGEVAVAWYASTTAGNPADASFSGSWNVHVARISGFFEATPIIRHDVVTSEPNHVGDFCMGGIGCTSGDRDLLDYFGIDHGADGTLHVAYGHDGAGSNAQVRYAHLS